MNANITAVLDVVTSAIDVNWTTISAFSQEGSTYSTLAEDASAVTSSSIVTSSLNDDVSMLPVDCENAGEKADDAVWILTSTFIIFTMQSGQYLLACSLCYALAPSLSSSLAHSLTRSVACFIRLLTCLLAHVFLSLVFSLSLACSLVFLTCLLTCCLLACLLDCCFLTCCLLLASCLLVTCLPVAWLFACLLLACLLVDCCLLVASYLLLAYFLLAYFLFAWLLLSYLLLAYFLIAYLKSLKSIPWYVCSKITLAWREVP